MMIAFAVHGVTSSSTRQFHVACLSHSLHGTRDFSHAIGSYQCAWFAHFAHDLPSVEDGLPSNYAANLLMPLSADCHYPDVALPLVDANLIPPSCALNPNLFLIRSSSSPQTAPIVRTRTDWNPEREWIQAHVAQTMNLQSAGKKASLILGQNIGFQCKKIKDTSMECSNKSLRTCPRDLISFLFFSVPLSSFFLRLIYHGFFAFFIIHVWTWHSTSFFVIPLALS